MILILLSQIWAKPAPPHLDVPALVPSLTGSSRPNFPKVEIIVVAIIKAKKKQSNFTSFWPNCSLCMFHARYPDFTRLDPAQLTMHDLCCSCGIAPSFCNSKNAEDEEEQRENGKIKATSPSLMMHGAVLARPSAHTWSAFQCPQMLYNLYSPHSMPEKPEIKRRTDLMHLSPLKGCFRSITRAFVAGRAPCRALFQVFLASSLSCFLH